MGREARRQSDMKFAAAGNVYNQSFLSHQSGHGLAEESLGGVGDAVRKGLAGLSAPPPDVFFVVDEDGGTDIGGDLEDVDTADRKAAVQGDGRRVRQQVSRQRRVRALGAPIGEGVAGLLGHPAHHRIM
jgi:hypothetical protein